MSRPNLHKRARVVSDRLMLRMTSLARRATYADVTSTQVVDLTMPARAWQLLDAPALLRRPILSTAQAQIACELVRRQAAA